MGINRIATGGSGEYGQPPDGGSYPPGHPQHESSRHADGSDVSELAVALSSLTELRRTDPGRFGRVMVEVASSLRTRSAAAEGALAPILSRLADRFEQAARAGDLPPSPLSEIEAAGEPPHHHGVQAYGAGHSFGGASDPLRGLPADLTRAIDAALRSPNTR